MAYDCEFIFCEGVLTDWQWKGGRKKEAALLNSRHRAGSDFFSPSALKNTV
jgi:hypothetical protein